jgi:hypothetical protein
MHYPIIMTVLSNHQRWALTLANRSKLNSNRIRDLRSKGVKDRSFFENSKAMILPSTLIIVDHCRSQFIGIKLFTFNEKTSCLLSLPSQKSKVKSVNLLILPSLNI